VIKSELRIGRHQARFLPMTLLLLQSFFSLTCVIAALASTATDVMNGPQEMHVKVGAFKSISRWIW